MPTRTLRVNGQTVTVDVPDDLRVLWVLRDVLGLTGPKYGCGLGVCQACTSHVNGHAFNPCSVRVGDLRETDEITTIEGLAASVGRDLHPAQEAWIEHDVAQCGFCQPGQIMAAVDLVNRVRAEGRQITDADLDSIRNICRCGTYARIREAIRTTAAKSAGLPLPGPWPGRPAGLPSTTARYVPLTPTRLFDTRPHHPESAGPKGLVGPEAAIEVPVAGHAGVPAEAVAVVLNVTVTEPADRGYVTAYPAGTERPLASSVNTTAAGQTRPNLVVVALGRRGTPAAGRVTFFAKVATHLVVDVAGYFVPTAGPVRAGRFVPLVPARVFDTRPAESAVPGPKGKLAAGQSIDVPVLGVAGVPVEGVDAVVLNLTGTEADGPGYLTVYPSGRSRPLASHVNLPSAGSTAPNLVVVPVGDDGHISVFSSHGAHALGDVAGYITDDTVAADSVGLFVPLDPVRLFDTRPGTPAPGPKGYVAAGTEIAAVLAGAATVPPDAAAVAVNLTATDAETGYVTAWPTGVARPKVSNVNTLGPTDTRANAAFLPVGDGGQVSFFSLNGAHLLADAAGYFL